MDFTAILFLCVVALSIWLLCVFLMLRAEYLDNNVRTANSAHEEMESQHAKNRTRMALAIRRRRSRPKDRPEAPEAGGEQ